MSRPRTKQIRLLMATADATLNSNLWQKFVEFLLNRRVRITAFIFIVLVAEDLLTRVQPHNLIDLANYQVLGGLGLVFTGLGLRTWAAGTLQKRKQLAMSGPYQLVRHPLYVGSYLMMVGFCLLVGDRENLLVVFGPILFLYILRAISEERYLAKLFPEQWPDFIRRVPRFIPRRLPTAMFEDWSLAQWLKNREYNAFGAALLGLVAIQAWHIVM